MQQRNPADTIFTGMQSYLDNITNSPFSGSAAVRAIMYVHQKNLNALAEANKCAFDSWQRLARKQLEMVGNTFQGGIAVDTEQNTALNNRSGLTEILHRSLLNNKEIIDILNECTMQTAQVMSRRVSETFAELKPNHRD